MPTYIFVPLNDQGAFLEGGLAPVIAEATRRPFQFTDMFVFSHGWWTSATSAMLDYDRFTVGFWECLINPAHRQGIGQRQLGNYFATGIHWPSVLSEDQNSALNYAEALSYFTMRERADGVGQNGLYAILKMALTKPACATYVNLIGHSFGCRVVCAALEKLLTSDPGILTDAAVKVNVVLLQAAFDQEDLNPGQRYGDLLSQNQPIRILVTKSDRDTCLAVWYPVANQIWDVVHHPEGTIAQLAKNLLAHRPGALGAAGGAVATAASSAVDDILGALGKHPDDRTDLEKAAADILGAGGQPETIVGRLIAEVGARAGHPIIGALGAMGPSSAVRALPNINAADVSVVPDWPRGGVVNFSNNRMVTADLTPLHTANPGNARSAFIGHHMDFYYLEIYRLIAGFLFG